LDRRAVAGAGAALVAALVVGVLAGPAFALSKDTVLAGETYDGVAVKLSVADRGKPTKFRIASTEVKCRRGGTLTNRAGTYRNFDRSDPGVFEDREVVESRAGDYDVTTKVVVYGQANPAGSAWEGAFKLTSKVFERGERVDACKLKTGWKAS
jgi:hypothetical protein